MSHQEAAQSRSEKGRDSGDKKSQAQQLVFMCQLWLNLGIQDPLQKPVSPSGWEGEMT